MFATVQQLKVFNVVIGFVVIFVVNNHAFGYISMVITPDGAMQVTVPSVCPTLLWYTSEVAAWPTVVPDSVELKDLALSSDSHVFHLLARSVCNTSLYCRA